MNMSISRKLVPGRQRGAALIVVLILLLVMTLLGLASLRGSIMEERMSAGLYDRGLAFQAAEAALREAEALALSNPSYPASGCNAGLCAERTDFTTSDLPRWEDAAVAWREATVDVGVDNDADGTDLVIAPEFILEQMGVAPNWPGCDRELPVHPSCMSPRVRVTARSAEANRARVILQTNVSTF